VHSWCTITVKACASRELWQRKSCEINPGFLWPSHQRLGKPAPFLILVVVARWPERMKRHERHANTFDDQGRVGRSSPRTLFLARMPVFSLRYTKETRTIAPSFKKRNP